MNFSYKNHLINCYYLDYQNSYFQLNNESLASKVNLLDSFKDQEILRAFRFALMDISQKLSFMNENEFYQKVGESFISSLRKSCDAKNSEIERKLSELNIQSSDSARISDFGDIIPVNFEVENNTIRKHQKWSIAEQKKLSNLINGRKIKEISDEELKEISLKFNRTQASVAQKADEISQKVINTNKKRKITENPQLTSVNDSISCTSYSKMSRDIQNPVTFSEYDGQTELGKSQRSDCLSHSRKKVIEQVLSELPGKRGSKNQIFDLISRKFDIDLHQKSTAQYRGFQQTLSKCFRNTKGYYAIKTDSSEYEALNKKLKTLGIYPV